MSFLIAALIEFATCALVYVFARSVRTRNGLPMEARNDCWAIFGSGTIAAGFVAVSHFVPWPSYW